MSFIIAAKADNETELKFYRIDEWSNDWVRSLKQATEFNTYDEAAARLQQSDFTKPNVMSDGTIYPPRMIHEGANLRVGRPQGSVEVQILRPEVVFHATDGVTHHYEGNIDRDTKEQNLNRIRKIISENDITEADLEMLRQNRR